MLEISQIYFPSSSWNSVSIRRYLDHTRDKKEKKTNLKNGACNWLRSQWG